MRKFVRNLAVALTLASPFASQAQDLEEAVIPISQTQETQVLTDVNDNNESLELRLTVDFPLGDFSVSQEMLTDIGDSSNSLLQFGMSFLQPEDDGVLGVLERTGYLGLDTYATLILATINHEFGHLFQYRNIGFNDNHLDLSEIYFLDGSIHRNELIQYSHFNNRGDRNAILGEEAMAVSGSGLLRNSLLAERILEDSIQNGLSLQDSLSYIIYHSDITRMVLSNINQEVNEGDYENDADVYSRELQINTSIHGPRNPDLSQGEMDEIITEVRGIIQNNESPRDSQLGVAILNGLDPHSIAAAYNIINYLITGDDDPIALPQWVPQINGYLGVPGPILELKMNYPFRDGIISGGIRGGYFPEASFAAEFGFRNISVGENGVEISGRIEAGLRKDGSILFDETIVGVGGSVEIEMPMTQNSDMIMRYTFEPKRFWSPNTFYRQDNAHFLSLGVHWDSE